MKEVSIKVLCNRCMLTMPEAGEGWKTDIPFTLGNTKTRKVDLCPTCYAELVLIVDRGEMVDAKKRGRPPKDPVAPAENGCYICPECTASFDSAQGVTMHRTRKHNYRSAA